VWQLGFTPAPAWRVSGAPPWAVTVGGEGLWDLVAKLPPGAPTDHERLYRAAHSPGKDNAGNLMFLFRVDWRPLLAQHH